MSCDNAGDVEFKPATLDLPDDEETIAAAEEEGQSDVEEERDQERIRRMREQDLAREEGDGEESQSW